MRVLLICYKAGHRSVGGGTPVDAQLLCPGCPPRGYRELHKCDLCNGFFSSGSWLENHKKKMHPNDFAPTSFSSLLTPTSSSSSPSTSSSPQNGSGSLQRFECGQCGKVLASALSFQYRLDNAHKGLGLQYQHQCRKCSIRFSNRQILWNHERVCLK